MKSLYTLTAAAAAVLVLAPSITSAQKITLKYLTTWDDRVQGTKLVAYQFGDMVKTAINGRIQMEFLRARSCQVAPAVPVIDPRCVRLAPVGRTLLPPDHRCSHGGFCAPCRFGGLAQEGLLEIFRRRIPEL